MDGLNPKNRGAGVRDPAGCAGSESAAPKIPLRVEAASWRGKPIYFQLISPWTKPTRMQEAETGAGALAGEILSDTVLCVLVLAAAWMARRNTRLQRNVRLRWHAEGLFGPGRR